ncbi:MAG: DUF2231 domain-containing protein [Mycobacteriales bacterium]|nr:DUF2231 domain-containing protein [Frankia sp.]
MAVFSVRPAIEFRGRKFKGLRGFAGKPFHPPLTDIPVGAYTIAPLLDIASVVWRGSDWAQAVYRGAGFTLLVGAVVSLATALTGYVDWRTTDRGTQIRRMANAHAWTMIVMSVLVVIDLLLRFPGDPSRHASGAEVILGVLILVLVTFGGTIGGSMVYDFGFNVETATDHVVYHPSTTDVIHPHDAPPPSGG